ncbi:MAG: hypothetical protein ACOVNU_05820 [Candidatus Kapaibacteriota bacterium]
MKNIHIFPTDKPSSLVLETTNNNLFITTTEDFGTNIMKFQNIYITSDEVIKEGDWACHVGITNDKYQIIRCNIPNNVSIQEHWNKIVLTTDAELIKDGVQAINDEFLEWFVENPNCEFVETHILKLCTNCGQQHCDNRDCMGYKDEPKYLISYSENTTKRIITYCDGYIVNTEEIIIPKEEPKHEYSGVHLRHCYQGEYEDGCKYGEDDCPAKPLEEPKQEEIDFYAKELMFEKKRTSIQLFTDYPITELGDEEFKEAPIRQCELLSYDDNKYCYVKVEGIEKEIKRCYIYSQKGRCGEVDCVSIEEVKDINFWRNNAEEDYLKVPISVLRYISELER